MTVACTDDESKQTLDQEEPQQHIPLAATEDNTASVTGLDQKGDMIGPINVTFHGKPLAG